MNPRIGITLDNKDNTLASRRYESPVAYSRAVTEAGGVPLLLPQEPALAAAYVQACDGFVFTGGADPRMETFGQAMHSLAHAVEPQRQEFEMALLDALANCPAKPVLGICLGMQFMALHGGGKLNQHLGDTLAQAENHLHDSRHALVIHPQDSVLSAPGPGDEVATVCSWHHQAVADSGQAGLRLVATAPDGVIEAIDDPRRPFYLGVQWHPERGGPGRFNSGLFERFVAACRSSTK